MKSPLLFFCILVTLLKGAQAQDTHMKTIPEKWSAFWITAPDAPAKGYGVYHFRKKISLAERPGAFIIHVSGDNRYVLTINEKLVSMGPARNDLDHWNYETVDIGPHLTQGNNVIAATVWNEGEYRPEGQISNRTGFLVQGHSPKEEIINTNTEWKCWKNTAYKPLTGGIGYNTYFVTGPGEIVDMHAMPGDWMRADFDDSAWPAASRVGWRPATPKGAVDIADWMLVPASLPQMELTEQRFATVRKSNGVYHSKWISRI